MDIDLRTLDVRILSSMVGYGSSELVCAAANELRRRQSPGHDGPVVVRLGRRNYAFTSRFAVNIGDIVVVNTKYGRQEGQVYAYGTGQWDPREHGPLKPVEWVVS